MSILFTSLKQISLGHGWYRLQFLMQEESELRPISLLIQPGLGQVEWLGQRFMLAALKATAPSSTETTVQSQSKIRAQMAGTVSEIAVKQGERVAEGDLLCILEAMKMRLEVTSPCSAKVQALAVSEAETVNLGQLLVQLEVSGLSTAQD
ncbi:MAG: acetyl-CoA carboxylase biotin carboxyl carrier protein subunit [Candidatus Sericytochromatia bacterium]|nr:acetyl-CoA carboxylase biotin carboxyl carrier protein subunit [Candidatus Sericytochromatia bacterium]